MALQKVAAALAALGKGIHAADASVATMSRRLEASDAAPTAAMRRGYRRLKPSMIASGVGHEEQAGPAEVERQAGRA